MSITRSITTHFSGITPLDYQLEAEVVANSNILKTLDNITINGDNVYFTFSSNLDAGEITELDTVIIPNHTPDTSKPRIRSFNIKPNILSSGFSSYTLISKFKYQGSKFVGDINYIDIISRIESATATYDIKIVKFPNMEKVAEITGLSNTISTTKDLGIISNIPETPSIMEVYVRKIGGLENDMIYIDEIIIYHGN